MTVPGDKILENLVFYTRLFHKKQLREVILVILLELGIAPKGKGIVYLAKAIQLYIEQPSQMITKGLYPRISNDTGGWSTCTQIERSIRLAIRRAWEDRDKNGWRSYFFANTEDRCPSNADFIAYIARVMEIWQGIAEHDAPPVLGEETVPEEETV